MAGRCAATALARPHAARPRPTPGIVPMPVALDCSCVPSSRHPCHGPHLGAPPCARPRHPATVKGPESGQHHLPSKDGNSARRAHGHVHRRSAGLRRSGHGCHRDRPVLAEETPHRRARPRTPGIAEGRSGGASRPRVTQPGHQPHLQPAATTRQRPPAHLVAAATAGRRRPDWVAAPGPRLADGAAAGLTGVRREPLIGDALRVLGIDGARPTSPGR